jgi:hypothetical protein
MTNRFHIALYPNWIGSVDVSTARLKNKFSLSFTPWKKKIPTSSLSTAPCSRPRVSVF